MTKILGGVSNPFFLLIKDKKFLLFPLEVFIFGSVRFLSKNVTTLNFFFKKTETGSNRSISVRFFRTKTGSNRFGSVFSGLTQFFHFGSVFFRFSSVLAQFFRFWLGFFPVFSVRVQFGFFGSRLKKLKPNRSGFSKF